MYYRLGSYLLAALAYTVCSRDNSQVEDSVDLIHSQQRGLMGVVIGSYIL